MQPKRFWSDARIHGFGLLPAAAPLIDNPAGPRDVAGVLDRRLAESPDSLALVGRFGRMSYAALDEAANAAAAAFAALGISEGDRIAATAANHNELVAAFLASQRIGAVWVGINRALALPEKKYLIDDCGAALYLAVWFVLPTMPRNAMGKIVKTLLADRMVEPAQVQV